MSVHPENTGEDQTVPPQYEPPMQQIHPMQQAPVPQPILQQQSTTNVVLVNQQPVAEDRLILGSVYGHRDWTSGLCGCTEDVGGCMKTLCCWECVVMEIAGKLNENVCVAECIPGGLLALRTRMRTLGGIRGSICEDYFAIYCFGMCAICQMEREAKAMEL